MNPAHFHLITTHLPLVGFVFGVCTLAMGLVLKNATVKKTGLYLILIPALFAIPAFLSGEGAEELVEQVPGISHHLIHEHEERGELFIWLSSLLGLLSFASLWFAERRKPLLQKLYWVTLLLGIFVCSLGLFVGYLGGKIRHPEAYEQEISEKTEQGEVLTDED